LPAFGLLALARSFSRVTNHPHLTTVRQPILPIPREPIRRVFLLTPTTMSGEAWLYLFAVLINAVNLFLQVFFTIMYSDLEWYAHMLPAALLC